MMQSLGFGQRKLIEEIIRTNWNINNPDKKVFNYNELLFVIQELLEEEGKKYFEKHSPMRGFSIFKNFVEYLLYRNLANYDSMVLITADKGCITGDACLEMPRDLKKYPKGIPLKKLAGKGPIYVYCFNKETKKIELKKSDGVEFVKIDDVYELELTNGMKIKATGDHPMLLINGTYKQLKDIVYNEKGGKIYSKKLKKIINTDRLRLFCRPAILNSNNMLKIDYSNINRKENDSTYKHEMPEFRFIMKQLGYDINKKIIHHKNGNHYDNNIENLEIFKGHLEHRNEHNMEIYAFKKNNKYSYNTGYSTKKKIKIRIRTNDFNESCRKKRILFCQDNKDYLSKISKKREENILNINSNHVRVGGIVKLIKYIGKRKVYDVVNVQDNHNFIVNGFVVSNTGKSSAAIMLARAWCRVIGIRFDPKRHIAYNNADMVNKIENLKKFEPLIADEAVRFCCITGDTKIKTPKGNMLIIDLVGKKNFEVISYNEKTKKEEIQLAGECIKTKNDYVYEVEIEDGKKIKCTKEHKFLTNNGWKELQELKEGDEIYGS